jgi:hypothetical protein
MNMRVITHAFELLSACISRYFDNNVVQYCNLARDIDHSIIIIKVQYDNIIRKYFSTYYFRTTVVVVYLYSSCSTVCSLSNILYTYVFRKRSAKECRATLRVHYGSTLYVPSYIVLIK